MVFQRSATWKAPAAAAAQSNNKAAKAAKSNKSSTNILEGQKRQGCVFHTTTGARRPECGEERGKPRCGARKGGGGEREEERLPVEIRWIPANYHCGEKIAKLTLIHFELIFAN